MSNLSAADVEELLLNYTGEEEVDEYAYLPDPTSRTGVRYKPTGKTCTRVYGIDWHDLWCGGLDPIDIPGLGQVEVVATHGGEGQGDQAWVVISVTDSFGETKLYRKDGYYASFEGADFDGDFRQVTAKKKEITVYG